MCSSCLGSSPPPPSWNMKNVPEMVHFLCFVFWCHPPPTTDTKHAHIQCVSCGWLLICYSQPPNTKNTPFLVLFSCLAPTPSPTSAFKPWKCARFGTFSVFDHLHPPFLALYSPFFPLHPFLALSRPSRRNPWGWGKYCGALERPGNSEAQRNLTRCNAGGHSGGQNSLDMIQVRVGQGKLKFLTG